MKTMAPSSRRLALTAHVIASVGWMGAIGAFLVLAVAAVQSQDPQTVRSAYVFMEATGTFVIFPLSLASLVTGLIVSLGTTWGLFRHHWVATKLFLNVFASIVFLIYAQTLGQFKAIATTTPFSDADLALLRDTSALEHASLALVLLVGATVLGVYKPRGMTRYGRRKRQAPRQRPAARRRNGDQRVHLPQPRVLTEP